MTTTEHKPTSQKKEICMTIHIVSSKGLSNALFLDKKLFLFKKSNLPLCSSCKEEDETAFHLYFYCPNVRNLWN